MIVRKTFPCKANGIRDSVSSNLNGMPTAIERFPAPPEGKLLIRPIALESSEGGCILSVVVPTYNEAGSILTVLEDLRSSLDSVLGSAYELIVVDDDSPDRTGNIAANLAASFPQLRVMHRTAERGLSSAVIRGWQAARGNLLATINADMQHPPALLPQMLAHMETADLAVATRYRKGGSVGQFPLHRQLLSTGARYVGKLVLPEVFGRVSDPLSGFYMVRRSAIEDIELRPAGFKTLVEVLARGRVREVVEVGYSMGERRHGRSNMRLRHWLDYLIQLARLRAGRS